ncbi:MAG: ABC transporter ATP-binding protein [Hyphomicrobiaceae bacterium]
MQDVPVIRTEALVKRYGQVTALDAITLHVKQGEFLALLGPSGCGKTTLLRTIAGFIEPTSGSLFIDGESMGGVPPNRRPVNTVFQNYALFPHLTVAENIAFGPRRRGVSEATLKKEVADALALVGMESYGARFPSELSGGQQQRVALARAAINRPKVLLLDEPLGALDLKLRKRMQLELKHLQARLGITFVFVTHDQEEALVMADRIAVMDHGRIMQLGTGEDIYRNPASRFVASFIGEANLLPVKGRDKVIMIRPEDIAVGVATADGAPGERVTVKERIFVGNAVRLHTITADGAEIVLQVTNGSAVEGYAPGQEIDIHWRHEAARELDG